MASSVQKQLFPTGDLRPGWEWCFKTLRILYSILCGLDLFPTTSLTPGNLPLLKRVSQVGLLRNPSKATVTTSPTISWGNWTLPAKSKPKQIKLNNERKIKKHIKEISGVTLHSSFDQIPREFWVK